MNTQLKTEVLECLKANGFPDVEKMETMDFGIYKFVLHGIYTVADLGKEYFEKHTIAGPKLKEIIYQFAEKYKHVTNS